MVSSLRDGSSCITPNGQEEARFASRLCGLPSQSSSGSEGGLVSLLHVASFEGAAMI